MKLKLLRRDKAPASHAELAAGIRAGDRGAYEDAIDRYSSAMLRMAMIYVPDRDGAEEVVEVAWRGVLRKLKEGHEESLPRLLLAHTLGAARIRAEREGREAPVPTFGRDASSDKPTLDETRFLSPDHHANKDSWNLAPRSWTPPEEELLAPANVSVAARAIEDLPLSERIVILLHDVEGWAPDEVTAALALPDEQRRLLLNRARATTRVALERHFDGLGVTMRRWRRRSGKQDARRRARIYKALREHRRKHGLAEDAELEKAYAEAEAKSWGPQKPPELERS